MHNTLSNTPALATNLADYAFFDLETPNNKNASICSIGVVSIDAITGELSERYWLVNPEEGFDFRNTQIHGLTSASVANSPIFPQVWENGLAEIINTHILVAHNASFDMAVLNKTLSRYQIAFPTGARVIDTMHLATDVLGPSFRALDACCDYLNIPLGRHHDSLCDAKACMGVFTSICQRQNDLRLTGAPYTWTDYEPIDSKPTDAVSPAMSDLYGIALGIALDNVINPEEASAIANWMERFAQHKATPIFKECYALLSKVLQDGMVDERELHEILDFTRPFTNNATASSKTAALQQLYGMLRGVAADGKINADEALGLTTWMASNEALTQDKTTAKIYVALETALEDRRIDNVESQALIDLIQTIVDPVQEPGDSEIPPSQSAVAGAKFCLTGEFTSGKKADIEEKIEAAGGTISKGVTKKCAYVVVGGQGSDQWAFGNYGTKVKKAMEYKDAGCPISIIREADLLQMLGS